MDFNTALNFIFGAEGGYANDPADRGGATNFGISSKAHPDVDVKKLTKAKAADIYKREYWDAIGADTLPEDMRLAAFDAAVQHGAPKARQLIEASGGDTSKLIADRDALYRNIVANDPSQAKFAKGWSNRLDKVQASTDPKAAIGTSVAAMVLQNMGDDYVLSRLAQAGHGDEITYAQQQGFSPREIVDRFGGDALAKVRRAQAKVENAGTLSNLASGAGNAVDDLVAGGRQLGARITGDDARLAQLQAQQRAVEANPERQAVQATTAGKLGNIATKAVPYVVGGVLAPEGVLPALLVNGALGATEGALTPTTEDGQFAGNVAGGAATGAGGAGVGHLLGSALGRGASRAMGNNAEATARMAAAREAGLPVNAATLSGENGFWRNVSESMPTNRAVSGFQADADSAIARKVAEGVGLKDYAGPIDSNMLNTARSGIKTALDDATNVSVTLPQSLKADLAAALAKGTNPLTEGIATNSTVRTAAANLTKAIDAGQPVSGAHLQGLASELKDLLYSASASHGEKQIAANLATKVTDAMKGSMSKAQRAAFDAANKQYRNLKAVEKMVKASNDTGTVSPRQMLQAAKTGQFSNSFLKGEAPYQDLASIASDLYGPSNGRGLGAVLGKAIGTGDQGLIGASVVAPGVGLPTYVGKKLAEQIAARLATSQNPTVVRLLTGAGGKGVDPALQAFIAKALSSSGAVGSSSP